MLWTLPLLMILLVIGTVQQKYLGLYKSIHLYFDSWIIWAGPLPLPGFYIIMGVFSINLVFRFLFKSPWIWEKAGLHLTHFGAVVLVIGGLFTTITAKEGYLPIIEGDTGRYVSDYHNRVLVVFEDDTEIAVIPFDKIVTGTDLTIADTTITIQDKCQNCTIEERQTDVHTSKSASYAGMAQFMALKGAAAEKQNELNMSGLTLTQNGQTYIAFEGMPKPLKIEEYQLVLGKEQRALPFSITLKDFKKETYPGSNTARAFSSHVMINDHNTSWPATISMNKPLRYHGYTLYQSSYLLSGGTEQTVLSVVENKGRIFPYVAIILMAIGLMLHIGLYLIQARTKRGRSS